MTRTIEAEIEARQQRADKQLLLSVYGGLESAVQRSGGTLFRLSIKMDGTDVLMTIVAEFPAGAMVCHVGSGDLAGCFVRALREAQRESLSWKEDKYRVNVG